MNDNVFYISGLLQKQMNQVLSADEQEELNAWLAQSEDNKNLYKQLQDETFVKAELEKFEKYDEEKNREYLLGEVERRKASGEWGVVSEGPSTNAQGTKRVQLWKRIAVAASIIGVLFVAGYWLINKTTDDGPQTTVIQTNDVNAPDKNRAQIKFADGTVVYLDSAANGELVDVNGVKVLKTADGKIEYSHEPSVVSGELKYHTLSNPRGSIVMAMTLGDGSKVWLNAGSSITYPVAFIGTERNVTLSGEAYFEIAHDATKPFKVGKGAVSVTVLGTHFNVNAYDDNSEIKVTLLEGSVRVQSGADSRESVVIKPGDQAKAMFNGQLAISKDVDVEEVMAWKNEVFMFNSRTVQEIMKEISRWYDVEIKYEGEPGKETFSSIVQRSSNVSKVLEIMKMGGMKFKVENRTITVFK